MTNAALCESNIFCYTMYIYIYETRTVSTMYNALDRVALIAASCITRTLRVCNLTRARVKSATSAASTYLAYECVLHIAIYTFDAPMGARRGL